jgi:maltoporin
MMAMVGVINVGQGATNLAAVKGAAAGKKESFVTNKDRLDNYLAQVQ